MGGINQGAVISGESPPGRGFQHVFHTLGERILANSLQPPGRGEVCCCLGVLLAGRTVADQRHKAGAEGGLGQVGFSASEGQLVSVTVILLKFSREPDTSVLVSTPDRAALNQ